VPTPVSTDAAVARNSIAAAWGAVGVIGICLFAIWRLAQYTLEAFEMPFTTLQWTAIVANVVFMAWSEGYRGFQQGFSPRVVARARHGDVADVHQLEGGRAWRGGLPHRLPRPRNHQQHHRMQPQRQGHRRERAALRRHLVERSDHRGGRVATATLR